MAETKKKNTAVEEKTTKKNSVKKVETDDNKLNTKNNVETKEETFENSKNSILKTIWNFIFWILIIGLFVIWVTDFIRVKEDKKPVFCVKEVVHKYDDGTTTECVGLGYKVYNYDRSSINLKSQFSPFFVSMEE